MKKNRTALTAKERARRKREAFSARERKREQLLQGLQATYSDAFGGEVPMAAAASRDDFLSLLNGRHADGPQDRVVAYVDAVAKLWKTKGSAFAKQVFNELLWANSHSPGTDPVALERYETRGRLVAQHLESACSEVRKFFGPPDDRFETLETDIADLSGSVSRILSRLPSTEPRRRGRQPKPHLNALRRDLENALPDWSDDEREALLYPHIDLAPRRKNAANK